MSWADVGCCRKAGAGCSLREDNGDPDSEGPQQHSGPYFVIPPNPARRNELQRIANKELEDLAKWKEQHKPGLITLKPQKLGGRATEAEVREKQQSEYTQSKYQQKLKKEDYERNKREAEEADILKKKAIQRGKANKLEEKRRQQEWQRQQMLREDHSVKTTEFLSRLDLGPPHRMSCQIGYCSPEFTPQARSYTCKQTKDTKKTGDEGRTTKKGAWIF
ncbi:epithelial-stromal interaction protein 1 [Liasis olivaceus]